MTISARFVSRNASFPTKCVMPQRPDLGSLTPNTELATGTEKMQRRMRRYKVQMQSFWFADCVSSGDPLTCDDVSCLSRCHQAFISNVCHFFGGPTQPGSGHCHEAHGPAMHRALLRHVMIGQSCVQGGRHLLPFHAEEESWKPAVEFSRVTDVGWAGLEPATNGLPTRRSRYGRTQPVFPCATTGLSG